MLFEFAFSPKLVFHGPKKKFFNLGSESLLMTFDHRILLLKYFITQVLRAVYTHCEAMSKTENLSCCLQSATKYLPLDR